MKKTNTSKTTKTVAADVGAIAAYSKTKPAALAAMLDSLRALIDANIPNAASKVWHGSPVWFIDDNPVVGYEATTDSVKLLFWNGQAFGEPKLKPVGKYGAAQAVFKSAREIDSAVVRRWLAKAKSDVFDSRGYFKKLREGR